MNLRNIRYAGLVQPFVTSLLLYVAIHAESKCIIICLVLPNLHMNEVYNFNAKFYRMYFILFISMYLFVAKVVVIQKENVSAISWG